MSWTDCTLGDVVTLKRGHDLPNAKRVPGNIPVVSSSGFTGSHNEAKAEPPGVVTGRYGTLGEVFYVTEPYWPLNTALYAINFHGNDPRFVAYFLKNQLRDYRSDKAAVPGVDRNVLHRLPVKCPDLQIQQQIVRVLSAYDDLIENNRRRIALLEEAARLLYREWFVHFRFPGHEHVKIVDGVPECWQSTTFEEVCQTIGGGTPSTKVPAYWNDADVTWITPTDITRNNCLALLDGEKKISQEGLKKSSAKLVPPYTILMTSRASVGFFGIIDREVCTNQGFINIIPNEEMYRYYLLFNLMERVEEIRGHAGGTTYAEISKSKFRALPVVMPKSEFLQEFDARVRPILDQVRILKKQSEALASARDLLLPRLLDGRLEVAA
jgi:type I restriction enzyme, S subunit